MKKQPWQLVETVGVNEIIAHETMELGHSIILTQSTFPAVIKATLLILKKRKKRKKKRTFFPNSV